MNKLLNLLTFIIFFIIPSQSEELVHYSCDDNSTSEEISNIIIDNLLPTLVNLTKQYGSTLLASNGTTTIYALAQCRGDAPNAACSACISNAIQVVRSKSYCPMQSGAQIWYNYCFLRYSARSFYGELDGGSSGLIFYNTANVTKKTKEFSRTLTALMNKTSLEALASEKGFGKGELKVASVKTGLTIYCLLQCNKDLLEPAYRKCGECLNTATNYVLGGDSACKNSLGCRVLFEGCFLQYEIYNFFYDGGSVGNSERVAVVDIHIERN